MNCAACRDLLQHEADGAALRTSPLLDEHLAGCRECRAFAAGLRRLAAVVRQAPSPLPPADFASRTAALVLADRARPAPEPTPGRRWLAPLLALAASLLVGVGLVAWHWLGGTPSPGPGPLLVQKPPEPEPAGNLRESVREAGSALSSLTSRTADEVAEQTRRLLPTVPTPTFPNLDPMAPLAEPPGRDLAQAGAAVAEGFEPVTNSARRAFDLFLRDVPLGSDHPGS